MGDININNKAKDQHTFDAIVVGSGITGGWAAKELCEKGLKTLVLERGRDVKHGKDYPTANLDPWQLPNHNTVSQEHLKERIEDRFKERNLIQSRMAVLTQPHNGRGKCMSRNLCHRGCPFGAYFSSNSSTLPAAYKTGNLTLRPFSVVHSIIWDKEKNKATGVRIIDAEAMETFEYYAPLIFLNASALATTKIMMQSKSETFPNGFANSSGVLGHYLMDHYSAAGGLAGYKNFENQYYSGQRSTSVYVPR